MKGRKTWVDNGDARVEAGELNTLAELGITETSGNMNVKEMPAAKT